MGGTAWSRLRLLAGATILVGVLWRLGTGPLLHGLHRIDGRALLAAMLIGALTTVCAAWRWSLVAGNLGVRLSLPAAVAACYRSQLLNVTLPGGVLGDVDRAMRHGRDTGDLSRAARAVGWDRVAGQVVQGALAVAVLFSIESPLRSATPMIVLAMAISAVGAGCAIRLVLRRGASGPARLLATAGTDIRRGLLARPTWPAVLAMSVLVVFGHTATFMIAARTAGATGPLSQLLPLALLVLLAMAVPMNVGGWGPREGAAAWLFAITGLGAEQGLATATVYGVLAIVASLPGAAVLVTTRLRQGTWQTHAGSVSRRSALAAAGPKGVARG
ncbi:MAG TPA: lysylphosphatidylglycerol synthase transmembrane domain-containing protein [Jatrophihabitans sp.]|nr:lysylphosphatidylglycerol synthase transmembrane domain-containing protein [Jatrophihabitans sp.]